MKIEDLDLQIVKDAYEVYLHKQGLKVGYDFLWSCKDSVDSSILCSLDIQQTTDAWSKLSGDPSEMLKIVGREIGKEALLNAADRGGVLEEDVRVWISTLSNVVDASNLGEVFKIHPEIVVSARIHTTDTGTEILTIKAFYILFGEEDE